MTVQIRVDWGDGTTEVVPAAGTNQAWTLTGKQHVYIPGNYTAVLTDPLGNTATAWVAVTEADMDGNPSEEEMPAEAPPGWVRVFSEDFDTDQPLGTWPGAYEGTWYGYDCTAWGDADGCDTSGLGDYSRSEVVSASGGMMHYYFHTGTDGLPKCAAEGPKINGAENAMVYGRYAVRWRVDNLPRFGAAFLLWPENNIWEEGEIDYPEGAFDGAMWAFNHCVGHPADNCAAFDAGAPMSSGWHTSVIEWKPGSIEFFLDGASIGRTTESIPTTRFRWVLQTGVTLDAILPDPATRGSLDVDWVTIDRLL